MKRILHICLLGPYSDGFTYQENLIAKYHIKIGYEVFVLASQYRWGTNNNLEKEKPFKYTNQDGITIIRLPLLYGNINTRLKWYIGLDKQLKELRPDILFIHGCQFLNIFTIVRYLKKYPNIKVYVDNHADFSNSATNWLSKNILHKFLWRICANAIKPYTTKFYGVLPARVDFLKDVYKLPTEKCELLVMGADDEMVEQASKSESRIKIHQKYNIANDDFLIITGGKINYNRPETLNLMQAINQLKDSKIKLIVFGSVSDDLKKQFDDCCDNKNIIFVGWQNALQIHQLMASANLIIFPGLHSVMWEQAVALGIPCIFRKIKGFEHVDIGGNCILLEDVSTNVLQKTIQYLIDNPIVYNKMKIIAQEKGLNTFSYRKIAKRSIE